MKFGKIQNTNREAEFAGQFYSGNKKELKVELFRLFEQAKKNNPDSLLTNSKQYLQALISPHAGYIFSGEVAASAFSQIPENANYKRVFVLASSHQYSFSGASIYCDGNYETPLGEIKVDTKLTKKLIDSSTVFSNKPEAHQQEHSLEVQLPFLQHRLGNNILLVPIILGTNSADDCQKITAVLKPYFTPDNLFVISTDFSHYPKYEEANLVDEKTAQAICSNQPEKLQTILKENKKLGINNLSTSLCGWTSVLTLLYLTENSDSLFEKIVYQNSGDSKFYGDKNRVVGYWAIAVLGKNKTFIISENEKVEILEKTRQSIKRYLETGKSGEIIEFNSGGVLNEKKGCFVSVYIDNELRGCIGGFAQEKTLNELVQKMAVSAICDKRFKTIKKKELEKMELEISVLSPLKKIESSDEIELGKHGIFIQQGFNSGTFLPQVANKTCWNVKQFLGHCSRDKAGIGWDGWKTADIHTFEAIIFRGK